MGNEFLISVEGINSFDFYQAGVTPVKKIQILSPKVQDNRRRFSSLCRFPHFTDSLLENLFQRN